MDYAGVLIFQVFSLTGSTVVLFIGYTIIPSNMHTQHFKYINIISILHTQHWLVVDAEMWLYIQDGKDINFIFIMLPEYLYDNYIIDASTFTSHDLWHKLLRPIL